MKYSDMRTSRKYFRINYFEIIPLENKLRLCCYPFLQQDQYPEHYAKDLYRSYVFNMMMRNENVVDITTWIDKYLEQPSTSRPTIVAWYSTSITLSDNKLYTFEKCILFNNIIKNNCIELLDTMNKPMRRCIPNLKAAIKVKDYNRLNIMNDRLKMLIKHDTDQYNIDIGNLLYNCSFDVFGDMWKKFIETSSNTEG